MLNKKSQESSVEINRAHFADDIFKKLIGKAQNPAGSDASRILRFLKQKHTHGFLKNKPKV